MSHLVNWHEYKCFERAWQLIAIKSSNANQNLFISQWSQKISVSRSAWFCFAVKASRHFAWIQCFFMTRTNLCICLISVFVSLWLTLISFFSSCLFILLLFSMIYETHSSCLSDLSLNLCSSLSLLSNAIIMLKSWNIHLSSLSSVQTVTFFLFNSSLIATMWTQFD